MTERPDDELDEWEAPELDDDDFAEDGEPADSAPVTCPYCGEASVIGIDAGGGAEQDYVEDCPVCCRPWLVHVRLDDEGGAAVWLEESE